MTNRTATNPELVDNEGITKKGIKYLFFVFLFILSQNYYLFLDQRDSNFLVIIFIVIMSICYVFSLHYLKKDHLFWLLFLLAIWISGLRVYSSFRLTTVIYSTCFVLSYLFAIFLLSRKCITKEEYLLFLEYMILFIVIFQLIQQVCYFTHIGLTYVNLGRSTEMTSERFAFSSITIESSHYARLLFIYSYSFFLLLKTNKNFCSKKERRLVLLFVLYGFFTMGSVFGLFLGAFWVILLFANFRGFLIGLFTFIFLILFFAVIVEMNVNETFMLPFERLKNFANGLFTLDTSAIVEADHSGAVRFLPLIIFFQDVDLFSFDMLFGYGVDAEIELFYGKIPGVNPDDQRGYILPNLPYCYGYISFFLLIISLCKTTIRNNFKDILVVLFLLLSNVFNSQITWLTILLLSANKIFLSQESPQTIDKDDVSLATNIS